MAVITSGRIVSAEVKRDKINVPVEGITANVIIDDVGVEKDEMTIQYTFTLDYHESVGRLRIVGLFTLREDAKKAKEVQKEWKESKRQRLPDDISTLLFKAINNVCASNSVFFSAPLGLNVPVMLGVPGPVAKLPPAPKGGKAE
jgi:hypothetical protein